MRRLPNTTGPVTDTTSSGKIGNSSSSTGKEYYKDLIRRANSAPLPKIFRHYGLRLDETNRKITCPFPFHNGGRENTPSLLFYPETNSFWCFGCKTGVRCCDFVSNMDKTNKVTAAYKILNLFEFDINDDNLIDKKDFSERLEILLEFSTMIRDFIQNNNDLIFVEKICWAFDTINVKHELSNQALQEIVMKLKSNIIESKDR